MSDKDKAMRQAIEVLEDLTNGHESDPALFKDEIAALTALRAALDAQGQAEPVLKHIADIAHCGGLVGLGESNAMIAIRRLTLSHWDTSRNTDGMRSAARAALRAAEKFHSIKEDET